MANELETFVLRFLESHGALLDRPAYGLVDAVLPDEVSHQLGVDGYLRLTFNEGVAAANPGATHLTYGHPLVDQITDAARETGHAVHWYIGQVRLQKPDLFQVIQKEIGLVNARLQPEKEGKPRPQLHHYLRFSFKVAFVSDEKQEQLVSVLIDVNSGQPAWELDEAWGRVFLEREAWLVDVPQAPLAWHPKAPSGALAARAVDAADPLAEDALHVLQERAAQAVARKAAPTLEALHRRTARRLELDLARLQSFYDDTEADLRRRLARTEDTGRRGSLEEKLAFAQADREHKLADVRAKYRLRLVLDLINVALITQPKLALAARVENRYASVRRDFIWDPLLHRVEPMLCDVCQAPSLRLHLCANGHLACNVCVLYCSACKREFCKLCRADMSACVVCNRPLCTHSRIRCRVCGQVTCQEHEGQCHEPVPSGSGRGFDVAQM